MLIRRASFSVLQATSQATHQARGLRKIRMGCFWVFFLTKWIKRLLQLMLHLVPSRHWNWVLRSEIQRVLH